MANRTHTRLYLILPILTVLLSGCVGLPFNPFSDDGGISVEAQVGKNNEKVMGIKKETTAEFVVEDSKFGSIEAKTVTVDEQVPFWVWMLMILGWLLPSPTEIYNGLGRLLINIKRFIKE